MTKGKFIVFEGIDGAGKTTQIELLVEKLAKMGLPVVKTFEPTDSETGKYLRMALSGKISKSASELASLFTLDRIGHNKNGENSISSLLEKGAIIICDRYYYSTMAYQGVLCDFDWVKNMNVQCPDIITPDMCIFLDLTPQESMERILARHENLEIFEKTEILERTRNAFYKVFEKLKGKENIQIISAKGSIDEVAGKVFEAVSSIL